MTMMTRRKFLCFLPALAATPLLMPGPQLAPPEREPLPEQEKHNEKVDGQIWYLLYADRLKDWRLDRLEDKLPETGPFWPDRKRET